MAEFFVIEVIATVCTMWRSVSSQCMQEYVFPNYTCRIAPTAVVPAMWTYMSLDTNFRELF